MHIEGFVGLGFLQYVGAIVTFEELDLMTMFRYALFVNAEMAF